MAAASIEAPPRVVRFGLFEVDLAANELRRRGLRIKLQDQQLNLLKVLLEHHGTLVTREELRHRLWKPDTFVEFDHSLNTAMMRLREVLGDSSENPRFIQTVPRKGYIFIAPVSEIKVEPQTAEAEWPSPALVVQPPADFAESTSPPPSGQVAEGPFRQVRLLHAVIAGALPVLVMVVAMVASTQLRQRFVLAARPPKAITSIAVLPMENLSGDSNQDYFADGMTDELIASLAKISSLRVISRTTAMEYKGKHQSLERIAQDLNVDAVVEGTVLRSGNRVRITAELVQVSTDRHLWADTYESPLGDILTLQNQVTAAIVGQIRIKLTPQDQQRLATVHPVNSDAYEDYLKGRYYWSKRSETSLVKAIHYYQSRRHLQPFNSTTTGPGGRRRRAFRKQSRSIPTTRRRINDIRFTWRRRDIWMRVWSR
jgi:TolB-like protein/DNA-binding winged helix-turn-helix (wHTH) protein